MLTFNTIILRIAQYDTSKQVEQLIFFIFHLDHPNTATKTNVVNFSTNLFILSDILIPLTQIICDKETYILITEVNWNKDI